jgi:hypothetical protein
MGFLVQKLWISVKPKCWTIATRGRVPLIKFVACLKQTRWKVLCREYGLVSRSERFLITPYSAIQPRLPTEMLCDYLGLPSIVHARLPVGDGYISDAYSFLRHDSGGVSWSTGRVDVRYWTSVLGIEHPRPSPLDEGLDNTVLLALQSGTEIAHC